MTTVTMPTVPQWRVRVRAVLAVVLGVVVATSKQAVKPHRAAIGNLASMPLTVAGVGCVDFAAFHISHGWGWLVMGLSLVVLEHIIADEP